MGKNNSPNEGGAPKLEPLAPPARPDKIRVPLSSTASETKKRPRTGGGNNKEVGTPKIRRLAPDDIALKGLRWDQARMLATTRQTRISTFALGGVVAGLPGTVQSVVDYWMTRTLPKPHVPSYGDLASIVLFIMFLTGFLISIVHYTDRTAWDELKVMFPQQTADERFIRRVRRWFKDIWDDFQAPL
jgi:hypothetical protein